MPTGPSFTAGSAGPSDRPITNSFLDLPPIRTIAKQLELKGHVELKQMSRESFADWPKLSLRGKQYIVEDWLAKKRTRTSWITDHGSFLLELTGDDSTGAVGWCCKYCNKLFVAASTTNAATHLRIQHGRIDPAKDDPPTKKLKQSSIVEMQRAAVIPVLQPTADTIKKLLLSWIVSSDLPLTATESPYLRELLSLFNRQLLGFVPSSGDTIKRWIAERYQQEKAALKTTLASSQFNKHLSFDSWTSPNSAALLAIVVHFVNEELELQTSLLGMVHLRGSHSGDTLATEILTVVEDFEIQPNLGYFQSDNASSNDTCITAILSRIQPNLVSQPRFLEEKKQRRLRCLGHIVNLVAKAFIAEADNTEWQEEEKPGLIKRLHNIVHYVRRSPQRREAFVKAAEFKQASRTAVDKFTSFLTTTADDPVNLQLVADNDTRWNSVYLMIKRAVRLRESVDFYCTQTVAEKDGIPHKDMLTVDDWRTLGELQTVLKPFATVTKVFEGNGPTLHGVVRALYFLHKSLVDSLGRLEPASQTATDSIQQQSNQEMPPPPTPSQRPQRRTQTPRHLEDYELDLPSQRSQASIVLNEPSGQEDTEGIRLLRMGIKSAITKLQEYLDLLDDSNAYWFAMILHPGHRTRWMELHLEQHKVDSQIATFKQCFQSRYSTQDVLVDAGPLINDLGPREREQGENFLNSSDYYDNVEDHDEVNRYLSERPKQVDKPLEWWKANKQQYPRLSTMAFDYLSIPAMSAECERLFSRAKHCLSNQRHSLHTDSINMLQSLKNWVGNNEF